MGVYKTQYVTQDVVVQLCNGGDDKYEFGFNGQMKTNEIAGVGNHNTALFWEYDTRLSRRWNLDPKGEIGLSYYSVFGNNPILHNDPNGDIFGVDNLIGAAIGAAVDYGFQVSGNIMKNGFSKKAFYDDVDFVSVGISAGAGFLTSGVSSSTIIAKGLTKETVKQVVKIEAKNLAVNIAESAAKQFNDNIKKPENKTFLESINAINVSQAVTDGLVANIASNLPGTVPTKKLEGNAKKLANIAATGRPRPAQTARAIAASKKVMVADAANETAHEVAENSGQNVKNTSWGGKTPQANTNDYLKPQYGSAADNARLATPIMKR
jgi:hypothetical protein